MLMNIKGEVCDWTAPPIVGKITRDPNINDPKSLLIIDKSNKSVSLSKKNKFLGVITTNDISKNLIPNLKIKNIPHLDHLVDGDIISIQDNGYVRTLFRVNSGNNTLLVTERCNSNCLMCSQPPKDIDDIKHHFDIHKQMIPLIPKDTVEVGISGGEPTLLGDYFYKTISMFKEDLEDTWLQVLTNGRTFAWENTVTRLKEINHEKLILAIPLYSDYYQLHDYIVQAKDAYNQTIMGLYNLGKYNIKIEIRVVLHKLTIPRLFDLSKFIFKNLTFVNHIAFMGLEHTGYTPYNFKKLWIDPFDYQDELKKSVEYLALHGMNISIYNLQLCLLPKELWQFSTQSISDWKNIYLDECDKCSVKSECGGFFVFNKEGHSKHISALL